MKRSEAVKFLKAWLEEYTKKYVSTQMANKLLKDVESIGMKPPAYKPKRRKKLVNEWETE
jgi:hypothetical protein